MSEEDTPSVALVIKKCKRIVQYFNHSPKATAMLKSECEKQNVPYHKLCNSVATRWNSTFFMLNRISELLDCIDIVLLKNKVDHVKFLTEEERLLIPDIVDCLKPFAECSDDLSGQSYPSISSIIPYTSALYDAVKVRQTTLKTDQGRQFASHLLRYIKEKLLCYETRTASS